MKKVHLIAISLFILGAIAVGAGYTSSSSMHESMTSLSLTDMQSLNGGCEECNYYGPYDCPAYSPFPENCTETYMVGSCESSQIGFCQEYYVVVCDGNVFCAPIMVTDC